MSWNPAIEPGCPDEAGSDAIETLIAPRSRDLGGFEVWRVGSGEADHRHNVPLGRIGEAQAHLEARSASGLGAR